MHRIDAPGHDNNTFVDRDPINGIPGTVVDDDWLNSVQEEIVKVVEGAGIALDKAKKDQMLGAIGRLAGRQVATLANLLAVDVSGFTGEERYHAKGYFNGWAGELRAPTGGGDFIYFANWPKSEHNGGTIISSTVPWDGNKGATHTDFLNGVGETDALGTGCWIRPENDYVSPHSFGVVDGLESTVALQAFLNHVSSVRVANASIGCNTIVNAALTWDGNATQTFVGHMQLNTSGTIADVLTLSNWHRIDVDGQIKIIAGGATYSGRTVTNGIVVNDASRSRIEHVYVQGVLRDGVKFTGTGNKNMFAITTCETVWCGSNPTAPAFELNEAFTAVNRTGTSGSTSQRAELTVASVPANVEVNDPCRIGSDLYIVTALAAGLVTVYPWTPAATLSGTIEFITGSGVSVIGGDSGELGFGVLDAGGCGCAIRDGALYGASIDRLVTQNCGIGHAAGSGSTNSREGGQVSYFYTEANAFDIAQMSTASPKQVFVEWAFSEWGKVVNQSAPRLADDSFGSGDKLVGYSFCNEDFRSVTANILTGFASNIFLNTGSPAKNHAEVIANSVTMTLIYDSDERRLFGYQTLQAVHMGTGAANEPTGTITITPDDAAWSINGGAAGASITFTGLTKPFRWVAVANPNTQNWVVARFDAV